MSANRGGSGRVGESHKSGDEPAGNGRRLVEVRCGFAEMARKEAEAAEERALEARRLFDYQSAVISPLLAAVDPVATKAAKEKAHREFRSSVAAARSKAQVEKAATVWLAEVNRINAESRAAQTRLKSDREALDSLLSQADKLADTAESSRSMAAAAADACRSAREALAESGESEADDSAASASASAASLSAAMAPEAAPTLTKSPLPARAQAQAPAAEPEAAGSSSDWLAIDIGAAQPQAIVRLLRRDGRTVTALATQLSANEPAARSRWQLLLSNFVDAVVAAAIDEAWFDFPPGNSFWDQFSCEEARQVARGLTALGFRYDGFGVFANSHVPGQRDLALAVGSAGLLPVRIRFWPNPEQSAELYKNVAVAGDAFIAAMAPAMTLGELVRLLGRRSEMLADLWNDWPRVRLLLLARA